MVLQYALVALVGYLLGSSNMALYLSRWKGIDLRAGGSGNLGASNAMILMGKRAAVIVFLHDFGKAVLAVWLARTFCPALTYAAAVAGVASVLGHIFPFYLRFKGGKGFASYLGMTLGLNWRFALVLLLAVILITLVTDYVVLGTVTTMLTVPVYLGVREQSWVLAAILSVASLVILYLHRANYRRIADGTEIGLRRANRGDDRKTPKK